MIHRNVPDLQYTHTVNLKLVKKILDVLMEHGRVKRTQLSAKTGMNYERCMKYVNTLKIIKLVEIISNNDYGYVVITQAGKEITNLLDVISM
jgi:predicted transcriptional regulator